MTSTALYLYELGIILPPVAVLVGLLLLVIPGKKETAARAVLDETRAA